MAFDLSDCYRDPRRVAVTAHRGFSGGYPENTIPAFLAAVELGVDILEFDLRGTRDGVPVVLHDSTFERTANRPGRPGDYRLDEIREFEASYWQGTHEGGVRLAAPALPGTRVPTFEELLLAVGDGVGLNIQVYDTSPPILAEICRLYREHDLYRRAYLSMSTFEDASRVRALDSRVELCVLARREELDMALLCKQKAFGCRHVQPRRHEVTPDLCRAVRELGLFANLFYSNTDDDNRRFIEMGIQGILTDRPDILLDTLQTLGRR